jgi:CCR4-NOT transcription complex subunit 9
VTATHNSTVASLRAEGQDAGIMDNATEESKRTSAFLTDLLFDDIREATLLELSKTREQVPELALILWHSFGMCRIRL